MASALAYGLMESEKNDPVARVKELSTRRQRQRQELWERVKNEAPELAREMVLLKNRFNAVAVKITLNGKIVLDKDWIKNHKLVRVSEIDLEWRARRHGKSHRD